MIKKLLEDAPDFVKKNLIYVTHHGSRVYNTHDEQSDIDLVGICIPPEEYVYPGKHGYIQSFESPPVFEQYKKHGMIIDGIEYDITVYGLPRYFKLCMDGNPNLIETLFTKEEDTIVLEDKAKKLRENRQEFLSKVCFKKFMGFARSHLNRIERGNGRQALVKEFGYDVKDASHLIRAYYECINLLKRQDIILSHQSELIYAIKKGKYSKNYCINLAKILEDDCKKLYETSSLKEKPDLKKIKKLLEELL